MKRLPARDQSSRTERPDFPGERGKFFRTFFPLSILAICLSSAANLFAQQTNQPFFLFDTPDETIEATLLDNPNFYDAGIAAGREGLWLSWLEFQQGKGDQLWIGLRRANGWIRKTQLTTNAGDYANPTPTVDSHGQLWLSFEGAMNDGNWDVFAQTVEPNKPVFSPRLISSNLGPDINHRVGDAGKGIWIVWQGDAGGQFRIFGARVSETMCWPTLIGGTTGNSWQPSATRCGGALHVICDAYDGTSYNVSKQKFFWQRKKNVPPDSQDFLEWKAGGLLTVAAKPTFEAHAQIAPDDSGEIWALWEEDGENWGQPYTAREPGDKNSTRMTDKTGPLHRFRKLHLARLDEKAGVQTEYGIPQPSFDLARDRADAPEGLKNFGAFYENGQLVVDGQNRPWIVYRHFYAPRMGIVPETHKQDNARLYARCLLQGGWSKLYSFSAGQGDGMQRISVTPQTNGITVAWTTGRTDRRINAERDKNDKHRGVAIAEIKLEKGEAVIPAKIEKRKFSSADAQAVGKPRQRPSTEFRGQHYELYFGDLHRHTDISLCFSTVDGTIDDAYRYGIDAAPLDFLGITDHTHDLDWGDPLAQIWWRSRKEVDRHTLLGRFFPFYSYERSRGDTDHNVISLRDDMLRPHDQPLENFWRELDTNTFTIPHQPFNSITWNYHDDTHRPLMEIYQGFRNDSMEGAAAEALARGHRVGIIASSDHLSTGASFAGVWAEEPTRESILRAMQARRTYGATAKIILKVTCAGHWMGEEFQLKKMQPITVKVTATATITGLELFVDGKLHSSVGDLLQGPVGSELTWEIPSDQSLTGKHNFYVRVAQADGNRAWSSPMWVDIK